MKEGGVFPQALKAPRRGFVHTSLPPQGVCLRTQPSPLGSRFDGPACAAIPIAQSRERNLALSVFKAVPDSSLPAKKSGGLLVLTDKPGFSQKLP